MGLFGIVEVIAQRGKECGLAGQCLVSRSVGHTLGGDLDDKTGALGGIGNSQALCVDLRCRLGPFDNLEYPSLKVRCA